LITRRTLASIHKRLLNRHPPLRAGGQASDRNRADAFFADLPAIARPTGSITHAFCDDAQQILGYVQLHRSAATVTLHRIWSVRPGNGYGSHMLRSLCELADRHRVHLQLKVIPLGAKPYPMSADQLRAWYHRHGFRGTKKLIRDPVPRSLAACS
jgi:hypothetical protein